MKIVEVFVSCQGEGKYAGYPAIFVRLSGCNLSCSWCDTKYHIHGKELKKEEVVEKIKSLIQSFNPKIIVWTGGEPTLQGKEMLEVVSELRTLYPTIQHHLETNGVGRFVKIGGRVVKDKSEIIRIVEKFDFVNISPKMKDDAEFWYEFIKNHPKIGGKVDIKVVTDLESVGVDMLEYATVIMPLTFFEKEKDEEIRKKVWEYCAKKGIRYSPRLQVEIFGAKKGV